MNIKIETISPRQAERWLADNNTGNRNIRQTHVDYLANEMLAGRWHQTGQGIAFFEDGTLADGQHRLAAIVQSGVSVPLVVTRGLKKEAMPAIDVGAKRNLADYLYLHHGVRDANLSTAALRTITSFCLGNKSMVLPAEVALAALSRFGQDIIESIHSVRDTTLFRRGWLIGVLAFARHSHREQIDVFLEGFGSGVNLKKGDPAHTLRTWLMGSPAALKRNYKGPALESAFNVLHAHVTSRPVFTVRSGRSGMAYFLERERQYIAKLRAELSHMISH